MPNKSKFVTVILSVLPGVGHLYLGWQLRGLLFMLAFFMAIFLMDWVGLSLFTFLLPVIWFYSLFDALQCYDREPPAAQEPIAWDFEKQRMVGIALITIGGLVLINKLAVPLLLKYLTYETLRLIGSSLVALLLIAGGIRLAWGKPISLQQLREEKMRMPARSLADNEGPSPRQPLPLENNSVPGQSLREEE
jgi:hypothetical protein